MGNEEHRIQLERLSSNADRLASICKSLIDKNAEQAKEIENLNIELNNNKKKLTEIEKKYNDLKLAQAFSSPISDGNKEAKQKINKIIREIDSCITLLKK